MNLRAPFSARVALSAFRALSRLLPREFRDVWFAEAEGDLERMLIDIHRRSGARATLTAGTRALSDLALAVVRERWADRLERSRRPDASRALPGRRGEMDWITGVLTGLRLALRSLRRRPAYAGSAIVTLGLGIGANVAIFAVVNAVLLRPLPYPDSDELVAVRQHAPGLNLPDLGASEGMLNFYDREASWFSAITGFRTTSRNLVGGAEPERITAIDAGPELFDILRVRAFLGRSLEGADGEEGAAPVVVLGHAFWSSRFGGDPSIVGRTLLLDGVSTEVVGVMPPGFAFPDAETDAYTARYFDPNGPFGEFGMSSLARLAPGVGVEDAATRSREIQPRLLEYFPDLTADFLDRAGWSVSVTTLQEQQVGDVASTLWIVLGTVAFVLLIACANVANLFLVRADSRQKEIAVRSALGAGSKSIAWSFLSEALVLGVAGGLLGVLLAWLGLDLLIANAPDQLPRVHEIRLDATAIAFAGVVAIGAAFALGAAPLLRRGGPVGGALRASGRGSTDDRGRHRTRNLLVSAQLAFALLLLVGSGLMIRSFQNLRAVDPGIDTEGVLAVDLTLGVGVSNPEAAQFYQRVAEQVATLPGVESVGLTGLLPMSDGSFSGGSFSIESRPTPDDELPPVAFVNAIGADYFATVRQPVLEGRTLTPADAQPGAPPVALVNRTFADRFLDGRALGERIRWQEEEAFAEIVGVVGDVRELGLRDEVSPMAYVPLLIGEWRDPSIERISLVIRSAGGVTPSIPAIRELVGSLDRTVPLTSIRTMDEVVAADMAETSFTMVLLAAAAGASVFLAAVGLFGVVSYVVGQRTREIGVRVALGAQRTDIRRMVLRQTAWVTATGVVVGLGAAFGLSRLMGAVLFEVDATDPVTFIAAPLLLVAVTVAASWRPARRASRVDPVVALQSE